LLKAFVGKPATGQARHSPSSPQAVSSDRLGMGGRFVVARWVPDAKKLDGAARKHLREIEEGGPRVWAKRMDELRAEHLR
jgi:hypothetical protein